jgi:hypothetical protein
MALSLMMDAAACSKAERYKLRVELARRLGWLNIWSPVDAEGFYDLDVSKKYERPAQTH